MQYVLKVQTCIQHYIALLNIFVSRSCISLNWAMCYFAFAPPNVHYVIHVSHINNIHLKCAITVACISFLSS